MGDEISGWIGGQLGIQGRVMGIQASKIFSPRWGSKSRCAHLLLRELQNYNSLLNNHWQENVGSHQKNISDFQGQRRSPSKMVGGTKSCLESNPIPARDAQRAQTNLVHIGTQRPHRDWARTVCECLLWRYGLAMACCRAMGSGYSRPGCGISPLGGGCYQPHHRASRAYTGLGKQALGGHKQNLVYTRPRRKEQWPPRETDPDLPWVSRSL